MNIDEHISATRVRLCMVGDSGAGKTGSLAALANAGYNLRVIDADAGLDILSRSSLLTPEARKRVHYVTFTDEVNLRGGVACLDKFPQAASQIQKFMKEWKTPTEDFGSVKDWGPDCIHVLDSGTFFGKYLMNFQRATNSRGNEAPWIQDYGAAMDTIEFCLDEFRGDKYKCHTIWTFHITYQGDPLDKKLLRGYPSALGTKLPPKVGRYFNAILAVRSSGSGSAVRRVIRTTSESNMELKTPLVNIPTEIPMEIDKEGRARGGLATYFNLVLKGTN